MELNQFDEFLFHFIGIKEFNEIFWVGICHLHGDEGSSSSVPQGWEIKPGGLEWLWIFHPGKS